MTAYTSYHPACLAPADLAKGPGDVVFLNRRHLALRATEPDHLILLEEGTPLFVEPAVACVRTCVLQHVFGVGAASELREAVSAILRQPLASLEKLTDFEQAAITVWISERSLIGLRYHGDGPAPEETRTGWMNGIMWGSSSPVPPHGAG